MKRKVANIMFFVPAAILPFGVLACICGASLDAACLAMLASSSVHVMMPSSGEYAARPFIFVPLVLADCFLPSAAGRTSGAWTLCIAALAVIVSVFSVSECLRRYGGVQRSSRDAALRLVFEDLSRMTERFVLLSLCALCAMAETARGPWLIAIAVLCLAFNALSWHYALNGRASGHGRGCLASGIPVAGHTPDHGPDAESAAEGGCGGEERMKALYRSVLRYMEEERPYLRDDFSLSDLAAAVYTNNLYLSKAVNICSGSNFRQFVNRYRIGYAMDLLREDKGLKMADLAFRVGFHSVVSFNTSFKLNTGMTPSEFVSGLDAERLRGG